METVGERELAALVGAALSTVQNRRAKGWLPSFHRDGQGRWRAPREAALAEWAAVPKRRQVRVPRPAAPAVALELPEAAPAYEPPALELREAPAPALLVSIPLVAFRAGAAAGREATPAALRCVLERVTSVELWALAYDSLRAALETDAPGEVIANAWRTVGAQAARRLEATGDGAPLDLFAA